MEALHKQQGSVTSLLINTSTSAASAADTRVAMAVVAISLMVSSLYLVT